LIETDSNKSSWCQSPVHENGVRDDTEVESVCSPSMLACAKTSRSKHTEFASFAEPTASARFSVRLYHDSVRDMCDTKVLPCKYDICYRYDGEYLCLCVAVVCIFVVYVSSEASSERKKSRVGARWSGGNDNQALVLLFRRWAESGAVILLFIRHLDMFLSEAPPGGEVCRGEKDNQTFALFFWG
jgi:hypothetical protein